MCKLCYFESDQRLFSENVETNFKENLGRNECTQTIWGQFMKKKLAHKVFLILQMMIQNSHYFFHTVHAIFALKFIRSFIRLIFIVDFKWIYKLFLLQVLSIHTWNCKHKTSHICERNTQSQFIKRISLSTCSKIFCET